MSVFLGTTAIPEFWDLHASRIVFLGNWCLRYDQQSYWQELAYEIMPHPWEDREAMHQAALYQERLSEELLEALTDFLNQAHREHHSSSYWRIIVGPWLVHFIQVLHERYLCLQQAWARYPDFQTIGLTAADFKIPRGFWDHLLGSMEDAYNLQIYTAILQASGHRVPTRPLHWEWRRLEGNSISPWKRWSKELWRRLGHLAQLRASVILADMALPLRQVFKLAWHTGFQALPLQLPPLEVLGSNKISAGSHPWRGKLSQLATRAIDPFRTVVVKTLHSHFPLLYLEGYEASREWAARTSSLCAAKGLFTSNGFFTNNESFNFLAAALQNKGTKLIAIQHGGFYGSAGYNPVEAFERKVADEFWSWGWGERIPNIKPMPSPKLSQLAAQRQGNGNAQGHSHIFYVGNLLPRYHYRTWSCPTANQAAEYFHWQHRFLDGLTAETRDCLIFRPFPFDFGWSLRQRLLDTYPHLRLDDAVNDYYAGLLKARMIICDMNQTTLLESLAANIPTVAFWNPRLWELRAEAESHFQRLREVGILYQNPEDAAEAVNRVWPEVENWWMQKARQEVRSAFIQRFARISPEWLHQWTEELRKFSSESPTIGRQ